MGGLRRGSWSIDETDAGFTVTMRPRIGPLSVISAVFGLLFLAVALLPVELLVFEGAGFSELGWRELGLFLLAGAFCALSGTGFTWLTFGWTVLSVEDASGVLVFRRHVLARPRRVELRDLRTIGVDGRWAVKSYWLHGNGIGLQPDRGPLVVTSRYGFQTHFGGNLSRRAADEIALAIARHLEAGGAEGRPRAERQRLPLVSPNK